MIGNSLSYDELKEAWHDLLLVKSEYLWSGDPTPQGVYLYKSGTLFPPIGGMEAFMGSEEPYSLEEQNWFEEMSSLYGSLAEEEDAE